MKPPADRQRVWADSGRLISLLLVLATLAVYARALNNRFINYDDTLYVTKNLHVQQGLSGRSVWWAITSTDIANWHPLTWLSLELDYEVYGIQLKKLLPVLRGWLPAGWEITPENMLPFGFHLTNILLHTANTLLLFWVLRAMTGATWPSAFVAALFGLHPEHVESVAWAAERKDVLSTLFWLLTMGAYWRYASAPSPGRYLLVILAFALGLAAKPMLVTLPCVLLLLDYWPLGRLAFPGQNRSSFPMDREPATLGRLVLEKLPLLALAAASSVVTVYAQARSDSVASLDDLGMTLRIENALVACVRYMIKLVWPFPMAPFYPQRSGGFPLWVTATAAILLAGITIYAWRAARSKPYLIVGWLWYLGTLVPVIGLVQVGAQAIADRYTYVPYIGLSLAFIWFVADALGTLEWPATMPAATGAAILAACGFATWVQIGYWHDGVTLWQHALDVTPASYVPYNNFAHALALEERWEDARPYFVKAGEFKPNDGAPPFNLGVIAERTDKKAEALEYYRKAIALSPRFADAHFSLANLLAKEGKLQEAVHEYERALEIKPDHADAEESLAYALASGGNFDSAIAHYRNALELKPLDARLHCNLGRTLSKKGQSQEARSCYERALELDPDLAEAHESLAEVLVEQGDLDQAARHCDAALQINPASASALAAWGVILQKKGDHAGARTKFARALGADPNLPEAHTGMGTILLGAGDLSGAAAHFQRALQAKPENAVAHNNLGLIFAQEGKLPEAAAEYSLALRIQPNDAVCWYNLGVTRTRMGQNDEALDCFRRAAALNPGMAVFHYELAHAYRARGNTEASSAEYRQARQLDPNWPRQTNEGAWLLATYPDAKVRNGSWALHLATVICEAVDEQDADFLDTLGAARAENGSFAEAQAALRKALLLLGGNGNSEVVRRIQARLRLYEAGQPFRDVAGKPAKWASAGAASTTGTR
jgi:tetratricopeptide (TPR) repeat protein